MKYRTASTIHDGSRSIAVDGSRLDDIAELLSVDFVMKGSKVYKRLV